MNQQQTSTALDVRRERNRIAVRKWRAAHREHFRETVRKWQKDNPDKVRAQHRRWYQQHRDKGREYFKRYGRIRYQWTKNLIASFKASGCTHCGKKDGRLDCHHLDKATKSFNIATMWSKPKDLQLKELAKCIVVCPSCHMKHEHPNHIRHATQVRLARRSRRSTNVQPIM